MGSVLTIDIGTSNLKVGVVDERGNLLTLKKSALTHHAPMPGAAEHDPKELWDLIVSLSHDAIHSVNTEIDAVVPSMYHFGLIFLDASLRPITAISTLSDIRAQETFEEFSKKFDLDHIYSLTGCPAWFQFPLARLYYFQKKDPRLLKAAHILSAKDYVLMKLTGEIISEPAIAASTQLMNIRTLDWEDSILSQIGVSRDQMSPIRDGNKNALQILSSVASELGIPASAIVLPGVYDGGALAIGLSALEPGVGVMNLGTTAMLRVPMNTPILDDSGAMRIQPNCLYTNHYLCGAALNNAAFAFDWLRKSILDITLKEITALDPNGELPPFCLPYLTGERDRRIGPFASGVFFGLRPRHTRIDMARSVLEGVAYSLNIIRNSLLEKGVEISEVRIGGGGASEDIWPQIIADVCRTPIRLPAGQESALIGSGMLAQVALGHYKSLKEAAVDMVRKGEIIEPDPERADRYQECFGFFRKLHTDLLDLFKAHTSLGWKSPQ